MTRLGHITFNHNAFQSIILVANGLGGTTVILDTAQKHFLKQKAERKELLLTLLCNSTIRQIQKYVKRNMNVDQFMQVDRFIY